MQRIFADTAIGVIASASVVGKKEKEGPLGELFDLHDPTGRFGQKTWESAESEMQRLSLNTALKKAGLKDSDFDLLFGGDLLNQCVGSAYGLCDFDIPYCGLYGACSTSAEGLILASMAISSGFATRAAAVTSSHYCSAERQYRTPLEYGGQRPPSAQWTVTGAGAFLLSRVGEDLPPPTVFITRICPGRVVDLGIRDANNMGAAMAPAALDTLLRFFDSSGEKPSDYDWIVTGDLGFEGGAILQNLMDAEGFLLGGNYRDCGQMIYRRKEQDVHCGGSGCGCSASVLSAYFLPRLANRRDRRILYLATGAMMSPDSIKQGKSIPAVAHLVEFSYFLPTDSNGIKEVFQMNSDKRKQAHVPSVPPAGDTDIQTTVSASPEWSKPTAPPPPTAVRAAHPRAEGGLLSHPSEDDPPAASLPFPGTEKGGTEASDSADPFPKKAIRNCDEDEGYIGDDAVNATAHTPGEEFGWNG